MKRYKLKYISLFGHCGFCLKPFYHINEIYSIYFKNYHYECIKKANNKSKKSIYKTVQQVTIKEHDGTILGIIMDNEGYIKQGNWTNDYFRKEVLKNCTEFTKFCDVR